MYATPRNRPAARESILKSTGNKSQHRIQKIVEELQYTEKEYEWCMGLMPSFI